MSNDAVISCKTTVLLNSTSLQRHKLKKDFRESDKVDHWDNIDFFSDYWSLTEGEKEAFANLRDRIADIEHDLNRPNKMIRFLRVKNFHVRRAEKMIRAMFLWRSQHNVDTILTGDYTPPAELLQKYPGSILAGNDRVGDPVLLGRFGVTDYDGIIQKYGVDGIIRYEIYRREAIILGPWLKEWELQQKRPIQQLTFIEDVEHLSRAQFSFRVSSTFHKVMRIQQEYYPEIEKRIVIIRTPHFFKWGWSIAKHFFDSHMAEKFLFCTPEETLDVLGTYNDLNIFPPCIYPNGCGAVAQGMSPHFCGGKIDQEAPKEETTRQLLDTEQEGSTDHSIPTATAALLDENGIPQDVWVNIDYFSQYWNLNQQEESAFAALRDRLADIDHQLNRPSIIVRFMKSKNSHLDRSETMVRNMIAWRLEHAADDFLRDYMPPPLILKKYPGAILKGNDREGDPVFLSRMGVTDMAGLLEKYGMESMLKFEIYKREFATTGQWLSDWQKVSKRPVRQIIIIEDLAGLSRRLISTKVLSLYDSIMRMDQDNYAESAKKILIIRAPRAFAAAWTICKHFFDPFVAEKMEFVAEKNYLEVLNQYMDIDILPPCVNPDGHGEAADGMPPCFDGGIIGEDDDDDDEIQAQY